MMPLMSLSSLLNILRPTRRAPEGTPGDDRLEDNVYVDAREEPKSGSGGYLVARDGRPLPLRGVSLRAEARGGIARVVLEQRFANPYQEALHVTYLMPLPSDAAVSGYAFVLGGRRIVGEIDRKQTARQRFEQAIVEGKTAGIVEQERSSLFTQELGNLPPGTELVAELTIDQKLQWRREGVWEWRFPTAVGPRYLGAPGQVADAAKLEVPVAEGGVSTRMTLSLAIRDGLPEGATPESPSHRLRASAAGSCVDVGLAAEDGGRLDRDVVVRWPVSGGVVGSSLDIGRPVGQRDSYGLLTLVPPEPRWQRATRRDLILLLDTSGSMAGDPLRQLKRTALALIDSLGGDDTLEMIEFSSTARRWSRGAREVTAAMKREARSWVEGLSAGGGTEMVSGMIEALTPLTERSQRQVILMTDGYIGAERDVITQVMHKLPRGSCRVHVVGVGSSVNRTLTQGVARAGAGVELILAPGEDAERLVSGLLARTAAPLMTHVEVRGNALLANAPAYLPDLYAGSPALISLQLRAEGGTLEVTGHTADGPWRTEVAVPRCREGRGQVALAALFARETVEDLELAHATTTTDHAAIDRAIEDLGLRFQISTRLTTWVAVSQEVTVDPSQPARREVMPHEVPHGVSVEGLGLRPVGPAKAMLTRAFPEEWEMRRPMNAPLHPTMNVSLNAQIRTTMGVPTGSPKAILDRKERREEGAADGVPESPNESQKTRTELPSFVLSADEPMPREGRKKESEERSGEGKSGAGRIRKVLGAVLPGRGAPPAPAPAAAPTEMRARIRHRGPGGLVILEITVIGELVVGAEQRIKVGVAGPRQIEAAVVTTGTTAPGIYHTGHVVRLVLDLGEAEAASTPLVVELAGRFIFIVTG